MENMCLQAWAKINQEDYKQPGFQAKRIYTKYTWKYRGPEYTTKSNFLLKKLSKIKDIKKKERDICINKHNLKIKTNITLLW